MKKLCLSLLFAVCLFSLSAQPPRFKKQEEKRYTLTAGPVKMQIDANNGARIVSFCYNDEEILSQIPVPNMYGSTFWTSPQKEWNWPPVFEHDMATYAVEELEDGSLTMTSPLSEKFPVIIRKHFAVEGQGFAVTYTIVNAGTEPRQVAPWEITRVLAQGSIFFDAPLSSVQPAGLMPFVERTGCVWYDIDHVEGQNRKINADGHGWLAYTNGSLLFTKSFEDLQPGQPAPDEAEIQVYVHQGNAYVELESQGAYTMLQPGEELSWSVRWKLTKL